MSGKKAKEERKAVGLQPAEAIPPLTLEQAQAELRMWTERAQTAHDMRMQWQGAVSVLQGQKQAQEVKELPI